MKPAAVHLYEQCIHYTLRKLSSSLQLFLLQHTAFDLNELQSLEICTSVCANPHDLPEGNTRGQQKQATEACLDLMDSHCDAFHFQKPETVYGS